MKTMNSIRLISVLFFAAACGGDDLENPPEENPPGSDERYLPMEVGRTWTYRMTNPETGETGERVTTVEAKEDVGPTHPGKQAFRVRIEKLVGASVYWQGIEGDATVRYRAIDYDAAGALVREQSQMPYRLKLDESAAHVVAGAEYTDSFEQTTMNEAGTKTSAEADVWKIIATDESVTVPAGTFQALHVRRIGNDEGTKQKDYWYVRGVGKVKETGSDKQTEELIGYTR
jgi:hypothetical protein